MGDRFARVPALAVGCRELSASDWRVLTCIALHADRSGRAYPSMATIAAMTGIGRGDVPRAIRRLERLGLLSRKSRAGNSAVNVYTVIFDSGEVSAPRLTGVSGLADRVSAPALTGCQQIHTAGVGTDAALTDQEQTREQKRARRAPRARDQDLEDASGFVTFWQAYPSRHPYENPTKPAREKFQAAVKRGIDPAVIIRGAENYRAAVGRGATGPRYVAQAVTWLREERWNDHQEAPEPPRLRVGMN
jgi:hypothetical protein